MARTNNAKQESSQETAVAEVMNVPSVFQDSAALRDLNSFEAALEMTQEAWGQIDDASATLGDGFALLANKGILSGVPTIFMEWAFRAGDFGSEYVSARVVAKLPGAGLAKFIVNDGGAGIAKQLREYTDQNGGKMGGLVARGGLRVSEYDYTDEATGETRPAQTWYIDTATA